MTSRHSVRHVVQAEVANRLIAKADKDVAVQDGVVARDVKVETITIGDCTSVDTGIRTMNAGRRLRKDEFAFHLWVDSMKPNQKTPADARARNAEMVGWLEDVLADDATLGGLVQWAQITSQNGPTTGALAAGGFGATSDVTVTVYSELN